MSGYDGAPAGGPGGRGSTGPGFLSWSLGWVGAGQGAWGRAVIRSQAVTITGAQGQVAEILRRRRRPLRTRRAGAGRVRERRGLGSGRAGAPAGAGRRSPASRGAAGRAGGEPGPRGGQRGRG